MVVVVRSSDRSTVDLVEGTFPDVTIGTVDVSGAVAAYNVGLERATGDLIAIIDDDAVAPPDWLDSLAAHFLKDDTIGGVGGRDRVHTADGVIEQPRHTVGKISWYGRVIGNHHLGVGRPRYVDVLKGANMCFRRTAVAGIRCDERMRGDGAQVHFELAFCLEVKRAGWALVYDPAIVVEHYPAPRHDADTRNSAAFGPLKDISHNETLALLEHLSPLRRVIFLVWAFACGTRLAPGVLLLPMVLLQRGLSGYVNFTAAVAGRVAALASRRKVIARAP